MKNLIRIILIASSLLFGASLYAADHVIQELNNGPDGAFVYGPSYLLIQPGDTVTFQPTDQGHNSESVFMPEGATPWKSDISQPLTVTFTKPGVYIYQCTPHNLFGMVGVIVVGSPVNAEAAQKAAAAIEKKQIMNQGRITAIMKNVH
ncbi:MAG: pseudoazurin [Gammaproteobacteria bacterium]|jgi:pseudoazurin|nr:pseudoazurin [Gammaproteobacteria bacterium]